MIKIKTSDNNVFELEKDLIEKSVLVKNLLEDIGDDGDNVEIPLNNVSSETFEKVIKYLKNEKDENFFEMDKDRLFELILAANYLDIEVLLDDGCRKVADMIKGKPVEYLRELFGTE